MQPTDAEISAALARYRERIVSHNRKALTQIVQMAEAAQPRAPKTHEGMRKARLRFIRDVLGITRPELGQNPAERIDGLADVEAFWPELVRTLALDGVYITENNEQRERDRVAYREGVLTRLREQGDGDAANLEFPDDFWTLMGLVDSLEGHGWPQWRDEGQQIRFWDGLGESVEEVAQRVVDVGDLDLDLECLAGWECGSGPETTCYVLYCRAGEDGGSDGGGDTGNKSWQWRYVANMGQYGVEVLDNVVELLKWHEELNAPDLEQLDSYTNSVFTD
ncbi:hypothetical protein E0Z10_g1570 [Xylaria hypoxylon]|uniref:Knr4/Smi1-like domain-containing protein n=1 Tax=Xylaria hypoxylon TaxID=37992 RepID=A0A4Z0Z4J4_9PEZI|nr:hypothetical protein E0Z10_g1570 [Xylaria hypoxylon]